MDLGNGTITINKKEYKYKLFDTIELINLIKNSKNFIKSLEHTIKLYRHDEKFQISYLVHEYIYYKPDYITNYFIIHKKDTIISTARFYYNLKKKAAYFNLIYTNPDYRGEKICFFNIKHLINLSRDFIKKYELEVDSTNKPAIKCYENIGFKKIKEVKMHGKIYYYMKYRFETKR
jgi:RimJ/RimL family protein N-acetyltransferase